MLPEKYFFPNETILAQAIASCGMVKGLGTVVVEWWEKDLPPGDHYVLFLAARALLGNVLSSHLEPQVLQEKTRASGFPAVGAASGSAP